ncbi:MAG: tripartite tricarboxylate transporter substrate binding protein [Alphaproteobacteria bacterium]|nr:tripartite tricarboxylate transporter substrate binding protein [Alphaproteobacteria bacterium]
MRRFLAPLVVALAFWAGGAGAQNYPTRPITLVVPFPAGGPSDVYGRLLAKGMTERLGQQVIVENKSGAAGVTGVDFVAKAAPDGYVIGLASSSAATIMPHLMGSKMPFDSFKDLAPITMVSRVQEMLAVSPSVGVDDIKGLVAKAKAAPGKLNYGSAGLGGITHLAGELFTRDAGIDAVHVPYRGAAPAMVDLLSGQLQYAILDITIFLPHINTGKIKPLMVTSKVPAPLLPNVPTAAQAGYPNVLSDNWYGLYTAAAVPKAIQDKIYEAAVATLKTNEVIEAFKLQGAVTGPLTPAELVAFMREESAKWGAIVKSANVKLE